MQAKRAAKKATTTSSWCAVSPPTGPRSLPHPHCARILDGACPDGPRGEGGRLETVLSAVSRYNRFGGGGGSDQSEASNPPLAGPARDGRAVNARGPAGSGIGAGKLSRAGFPL